MDKVDFSWNPLADPKFAFYDPSLLQAVKARDEATHRFFRLLSLCHTVMPEETKEGEAAPHGRAGRGGHGGWRGGSRLQNNQRLSLPAGTLVYQAQSPDEGALVTAARNFGFVFRARTPTTITVVEMGETVVYELLAILDFNNVRKRMSVIGVSLFLSTLPTLCSSSPPAQGLPRVTAETVTLPKHKALLGSLVWRTSGVLGVL